MAATNRLGDETSPYLRQHAGNPVDWYPWGEEAFARARAEDKPVFLSVGYSACHWCHVMAHESFEDPATAQAINDVFVSIKVDREERPDVDAVYMDAVMAVNGGGGWPMTAFLLPDGRPFFAGTYYPRAALVSLTQQVGDAWTTRRSDVERDAAQLHHTIASGARMGSSLGAALPAAGLSAALVDEGVAALAGIYDAEWGGFGRAPKFPQPTMLELLLRSYAHDRDPAVLAMVTNTLDAMASGGIYDHLAGGFARYATDRHWLIPHFEKMLYDNAQLVRLYTHAWQITGEARYRQVVEETLAYLLSPPMLQPEGGFSSAEDADSEGVEGRFYVWSAAEVDRIAGPAAVAWYGVTREGNWEHGHNVLWRPQRGDLQRPPEIEEARRRLLAAREERVRPGLDDKVLTEWNAMTVAALAEAGATFERPDWLESARRTATFLLDNLRRPDGRWLRSWQGGRAHHLAYAVDYAWLVEAFTRLGEATGEARWIDAARTAADELLELFWDGDEGGLYTTGTDGERLIVRSKDTYDGATPSANSVAALALLRLGALTGESRYRDRGTAIVAGSEALLAKAPSGFTTLLAAADVVISGVTEVVMPGRAAALVTAVQRRFLPTTVVAWGEPYPSPLWEGRTSPNSLGKAYVCRDYACLAPVEDETALVRALVSAG